MPARKEAMEQRHDRLTAVVLADTFQQRFRPITVERPNVLLPLVNTPMLDYVLEWLASNHVEEVYVFCCSNADKIQKHINETKWGSQHNFDVKVIVSTNCYSAGEAMRLIDQQDIIKNDFVLVSGDCISNMALKPVLDAHKQRRESDKLAIMTSVMMSTTNTDHTALLGESELVVSLDPQTQRLLDVKFLDSDSGSRTIRQDTVMFSERDVVELRMDLVESQVYICSPEVLMLFSDNFDFQNIRHDFVTGVLSEEELGNKIYIHELKGEYGIRVGNLRAYDAVSRDIINRWAFPFVPDTNCLQSTGPWDSNYSYQHGNIYLDKTVTMARSVKISRDTVVGADTAIGERCSISSCVIGRGCRIGPDVQLHGCYIHDNVTIHEAATLKYAIICDNVVVKRGADVGQGAILSYGVVVGPSHHVPNFSRLTLCRQAEQTIEDSDDEAELAGSITHGFDSDDEEGSNTLSALAPKQDVIQAAQAIAAGKPAEPQPWDLDICGVEGAGFAWKVKDTEDNVKRSIVLPALGNVWWEIGADEDLELTCSLAAAAKAAAGQAGGEEPEEWDPDLHFKREVAETFLRCAKMRFDQANVTIEINALKLAENKTFADCANHILTTIMGMCLPAPSAISSEYSGLYAKEEPDLSTNQGNLSLLRALKGHLSEWAALLQKYLRAEDDQVDLLLTLEEFCGAEGYFSNERGASFAPLFCKVLEILYDLDILSEEACLTWAGEKEHADEEDKLFLNKAKPFLKWLEEAESEEEEDDDEEEEEDE